VLPSSIGAVLLSEWLTGCQIISRALTQVLTAGTLVDEKLIGDFNASFLMAIRVCLSRCSLHQSLPVTSAHVAALAGGL
jgi:hypothetical protein